MDVESGFPFPAPSGILRGYLHDSRKDNLMKIIRLLPALFLALACPSIAAELLWEDFDSSPTGAVTALPGWTRSPWYPTHTGRVVNINYSHSPSNILELQWSSIGSSAAFTNFSVTYTTAQHPVIRFSAKLVAFNTNTFFRIGLRNSNTTNFLAFQSSNGYGVVGFNTRTSVYVPLINNRFVDLSVLYNRSNGQVRLDYDYLTRLPWTNSDVYPTIHTQFNQFGVIRHHIPTNPTGSFLVDDVSVETFPPDVWAWWRCSPDAARFIDQLGTFTTTQAVFTASTDRSSDPIWDGQGDSHNRAAPRGFISSAAPCALATPSSSNWTLEAAFRMPSDSDNTAFLDWGTASGFNTNGPWIGIGYLPASTSLYCNLRDAQQGDSQTYTSLGIGPFRPNGRWQHIALVKSNATLSLYVDYQFVTNRTLIAPCAGAYAFGTHSRATVGGTLNHGNGSGENTFIDEVRFSGKALTLSEFLQPGQPLIVKIDNSPTNAPWELTAKCILGQSYHLETSPFLGSGSTWLPIPGTTFTSMYTFHFIDVPDTTPRTNFVRLVREH